MKTPMKWFCVVLLILGFIWAVPAQVLPGKQIGQYPNKATPGSTDLFIMEQASPKTNVNISAFQLKSWITSGLAQASFNTNILATTNYVVTAVTNRVFVAPGSTNVVVVTNYGSGTVTYTIYVTNSGVGDNVWTNELGIIHPVSTNEIQIDQFGGIVIGPDAPVGVTYAFLAAADTSVGTNSTKKFELSARKSDSYNNYGAAVFETSLVNTNFPTASLTLDSYEDVSGRFGSAILNGGIGYRGLWVSDEFGTLARFWPDEVDGATPHTLNTSTNHTSGYLFELFNFDRKRFAITYDGKPEITNGAAAGFVLTSDANGVGSWAAPGSALATNAISAVWSNNVNVATPATNLNFWFLSTSGVNLTNRSGLVDVRFSTLSATEITNLINTASNFLWTNITSLGSNYTLSVSNDLYTNLVAQINTTSNNLYTNLITLTQSGLRTNQYTLNDTNSPVKGSLWFTDSSVGVVTNGSRIGAFEFAGQKPYFRGGSLANLSAVAGLIDGVIAVSNSWDTTNIAFGTFAWGSNSYANSVWSTVAGGINNAIRTNGQFNYIGGGSNNVIGVNAVSATISGGRGNTIDNSVTNAPTIGGGYINRIRAEVSTIGGGQGNDVRTINSVIAGGINNVTDSGDTITVGGGQQNEARGDWAVIGGGQINIIGAASTGNDGISSGIFTGTRNKIGTGTTLGASYSFIGGGRSNSIPDVSDYGTIGGGSFNQVGGGGNPVAGNTIAGGFNNLTDDQIDYGSIGGGQKNLIGGDFGTIPGGVSNRTTVALAAVLGNFITNSATKTVDLGFETQNRVSVDTNGVNFRGVTNLVAGTITNLHRYVGRVRLASGQSTYFITNNLVTVNTILMATLNSDCGTILSNAVPTAGLITIKTLDVTSANADISFQILTP